MLMLGPLNGRVANCVWAQLDAQCPSAAAVAVPLRVKVEPEVVFMPWVCCFSGPGFFYNSSLSPFWKKKEYNFIIYFLVPICLLTTALYGQL